MCMRFITFPTWHMRRAPAPVQFTGEDNAGPRYCVVRHRPSHFARLSSTAAEPFHRDIRAVDRRAVREAAAVPFPAAALSEQNVLGTFALRQQGQRLTGNQRFEMVTCLMRGESRLVGKQFIKEKVRRIFLTSTDKKKFDSGFSLSLRKKTPQNLGDLF
jgi:hypothetical protein